MKFMEKDIVAVIGPQESDTAHVISQLANELHVPLLSFTATDPTLTSLQYPYFIRTSHSDLFQMAAIAELVEFYGWKQVTAIYLDDSRGRNGVAALGDKLAERRCKISYKSGISPGPGLSRNDISDLLVKVALMESRVIVLHTNISSGLLVLSVAKHLEMMDKGYVWIATDWLSSVLDSRMELSPGSMDSMQGVLTLRQHTADSEQKKAFLSRWRTLAKKGGSESFGLNAYGLYAYDTVWIIAHAIDKYLNEGGVISFSNDSRLKNEEESGLHFEAMSIFDGGEQFRNNILQMNFVGLTGLVQFDHNHLLVHPAYDIINVVGTGQRSIGYWSNYSGFSIVPPESLYSRPAKRSSANQQLSPVIWPGETVTKPRGWVFPSNGKELRIGVPKRVSFREFVSEGNVTKMVKGFCIDVFAAAVNLLPYPVPYRFVPYGDGKKNPSFTDLVNLVASNVMLFCR